MLLHKLKEFNNQIRNWSNENLFFALTLSINNSSETIAQDVYFDHISKVNILIGNNMHNNIKKRIGLKISMI